MFLVIFSHKQEGKWPPNRKKKKKGVPGGIFRGKPKERNHYEMNHVLISLSQRKTPNKIFTLASKQHNNSSNKPLAPKRFDFAHGALEY